MNWREFFFGPAQSSDDTPTKGVEFTDSHLDGFQTNTVTVRTVSYSGSAPFGSYSAMYRRQPAVRAAVDFLGRNIGQLNPKVFMRVAGTDRVEVSDHRLAVTLRNPNPTTTRFAHLRDTVCDLAIYDRAYWRKVWTESGSRLNLVRIPPGQLNVTADNQGRRRFTYVGNGEEVARSELVIFAGYSPDGGSDGVSPLETLRRVLAEESAAVANREGMWINSARQSGWITRPETAPEWSDTARGRFRADLEAVVTGESNAGRVGVLEEGMKWDPAKFEAPTDDYIAGRRLTYEEVAIAYGIPPLILGMGTGTNQNAAVDHRRVYQDVLGPWMRFLQDEIELQVLPDLNRSGRDVPVYVEFNLKEKLRGAFEEEQRAITTGVGVPHMTVNEGRAIQNLPRIPAEWADIPVQPLNVLYGGQPAVTVPTATPATASFAPQVKSIKAPDAALRRRERAAKEHEDMFRSYFERQQRSVKSAKAVLDRERWDRELTTDLYGLAALTARRNGQLAADQIGGVYDHERTLAWLLENSRIAAESINAHTIDELEGADAERVAEVFDIAQSSRSEQLGLGRATGLIAFARVEAARHSQDADGEQRYKLWVVTSQDSRHPELNGERVPVGDNFSNGLPWPGAATGGADDVAGCKCLLGLE